MPTTQELHGRDPVIVAGRREPVFADQHNWMAQSAFEVIKLAKPLNDAALVARAVEVVCSKVDTTQVEKMAETVMFSATGTWQQRIIQAIEFAQEKLQQAFWHDDPYNFEHTHLGAMVGVAVVGYFVPEGSNPPPELYREMLLAPLRLALRAAALCEEQPMVAEFICEIGTSLPMSGQELLTQATTLTQVVT
jgi:hypothetical protein